MAKQKVYYGLQTPSGIIVPIGTERPKLSAADRRDFWKVIRLHSIVRRAALAKATTP